MSEWNINKYNNKCYLQHSHKGDSYFCYKVYNNWYCGYCNNKAPEDISLMADLAFSIPITKVNSKDYETFRKHYIVARFVYFWCKPNNTSNKEMYLNEMPQKQDRLLGYYDEYRKDSIKEQLKEEQIVELFNSND